MAIRTITAPGVEIKEIDKSGYTPAMTGTAVYLKGFSPKGEAYKPFEITTRSAFEQIFGVPDTEAERYFYAGACETLNQNGRLFCARLPYDNASFEKMVGIKYKLKKAEDVFVSDEYGKKISAVTEVDKELKDAYVIEGGKTPVTYDLSAINEFRSDEAKVPANSFLIVDTTLGTYNRVVEDYRKGEDREVIGIVPVVTTLPNALYAQSYVNPELSDIHNYEVLEHEKLLSLKDSFSNNGLLSGDVVVPYNTVGMFNIISDEVHLSAVDTEFTIDDCATPAAAVAKIQELCAAAILTLLSDVEPNLIEESLSVELATFMADEQSLTGTIDYIADMFTLTRALLEKFGMTHRLETLFDVYIAVSEIIEAIDRGEVESSLYDSHAVDVYINNSALSEQFSDEDTVTILNLADAILALLANATGHWAATYKYRVAVAPFYDNTSVGQTQSLDAAAYFPTIQPAVDGEGLYPEHLKDIGVVVFKMYLDPAEGNKVSYEIVEAFAGSLYKDDKDPNTGVSKFIDTIINTNSKYINFFSNCFASTADKKWYNENCDLLVAKPALGATLGFYSSMTTKDISISRSILDGMNKAFDLVSDVNKLDIDIVPDAGISNIASYLKAIFGDKGPYDLSITDSIGNSLLGMWKADKATSEPVMTWKNVLFKHDNFCKNIRKDCMFVADGLRPLVLQGLKKTVRDTKPSSSIDKDIIPFIPAICGINTSYGAGYCDWFLQADDYTGDFFWCPPSIKATGVYINTDVNFEYWLAPAGLNRGVIAATDVAFSPTGKQAGAFYEKNWNYAINYPQDGIVLEGQKTFLIKPTALDRVNVRRTMLRLERAVYKTIRYFVYENNTAYTRQRIVDAIEPIMKNCWQSGNGGIARYKIVCDESNNTPNVIDNNELKVLIGLVPNKSAEFVLVDFILGNQGSTWAELLG